MNKAKITERDMKEYQGGQEQFKKRRFDSGAGPSRQRASDVTTILEQSQAKSSAGGARSSNLRGGGSSRGGGSWRPPTRPSPTRSSNTWGLICYLCGVEGHVVRDCPMPWVDNCYRCGQRGHISRNCTQGPTTTSLVSSVIGEGRRAVGSAR